jgi:2-hydroxyacyl-CoA lyase 1
VKFSICSRPGPTYIEIPGNFITETIPASNISYPPSCPDPPTTILTPDAIRKAADAIKGSVRPVTTVVIGKGAAYGRADNELRQLLVVNHLPFLPTPMGKGVVSDDHPLCVAAARSKLLKG